MEVLMVQRITDGMKRRAERRRAKPVNEQIIKGLGNSIREQIMWILNERIASPSEIAEELSETLNRISHHIKVLKDAECIELAYMRPVGGAVEHFYKATSRVLLDDDEWPVVPETVRQGLRTTLLRAITNDAVEAVSGGTYDACEDSHMSWTPMIIDEEGREELTRILEHALMEVLRVQDESKERLIATGAAGFSYSVSILGYPSTGGQRPVAPPSDARKASRKKAKSTTKGRSRKAAAKPKRKGAGK
jgi:DNA-binding transcriptional ArsR family regulator